MPRKQPQLDTVDGPIRFGSIKSRETRFAAPVPQKEVFAEFDRPCVIPSGTIRNTIRQTASARGLFTVYHAPQSSPCCLVFRDFGVMEYLQEEDDLPIISPVEMLHQIVGRVLRAYGRLVNAEMALAS